MAAMGARAINDLCSERGWTRSRLILELRKVARTRGIELPADESLKRMIREWANGRRGLSDMYAELLGSVFDVVFPVGHGPDATAPHVERGDGGELQQRLSTSLTVDDQLVSLLEGQTQSFRLLDRQLGAARLLAQTEAHVQQMSELLAFSLPGRTRAALAAAVAEAAALAGWQALDLGSPISAWKHHETAKAAARESGNAAVLAHVTAQQAIALLDLDRADDARTLVQYARKEADENLPRLLRAWLLASEGETLAAGGDRTRARHALDAAARLLPSDPVDPELPFVFLSDVHLRRWSGHCLARLGERESLDELSQALAKLDPSFTRAAAGLHCDLALAHTVRKERDAALEAARRAEELARRTASVRQRRRITHLLAAHSAADR